MVEKIPPAEHSPSGHSLGWESWRKPPNAATGNLRAGTTLTQSSRINVAQFLGAPLALINQDLHDQWIAFNKQSWGLLITTLTNWWSPTLVRVSGDKSVRGQLQKTVDGSLYCDFSERMVLMANHQVDIGGSAFSKTTQLKFCRSILIGSTSGTSDIPTVCTAAYTSY